MNKPKLVLGLDLGTNSLGWVVLDPEAGKIYAAGVHVFQEGVANLGQGDRELSPNADRRLARQRRKQLRRRRMRKEHLLRVLDEHGMAPGTWAQFRAGEHGEAFREWFRLNPYELRRRGLTEALTPAEFGRVLYHLSQRRGFQSNSRRAVAADASEKSAIMTGSGDKPGIQTLTERLAASGETLGEYLADLHPVEGEPFRQRAERIRNRWTSRRMYVEEFERLWQTQAGHHPGLFTRALREDIGGRRNQPLGGAPDEKYEKDGILFWQRPLKSQRGAVGRCRFEPGKSRMPKAHPLYEEFRVRQFVNNIAVDGEPLSQYGEHYREKAAKWLMGKDRDPTFVQLRKHLRLADDYYSFNYPDDTRVPACPTIAKLSSKLAFGQAWWGLSPKQQEDRWHVIYEADDIDWLEEYAQAKWGLTPAVARDLARKLNLAEGYGALSRKAINNILPFLRLGYVYSDAVVLGGVVNGFGESWDMLADERKTEIATRIFDIIVAPQQGKGGLMPRLHEYLRAEHNFTDRQLARLYHHSQDQAQVTGQRRIHRPESEIGRAPGRQHEFDEQILALRNPVVERSLFELRRVVNAVADAHGHPDGVPFDRIHLEMGKDLKGNKEARQRTQRQQLEARERNDRVSAELEAHGVYPSHLNRLKYKLWEECGRTCIYSGRAIGFSDLFGDTPAFEIEHILPYSRTLDDSWTNKTLCEIALNRDKGDRTPYEYFSQRGDWEEVKSRALQHLKTSKEYPNRYAKFKRFASEELPEGFISRQLNDTRYAAREGRKLLQQIVREPEHVLVLPGRLTADLRHLWGLNALLAHRTDTDEEAAKNREDHRHHAIDAVVVACSTQGTFQQLATWTKYGERRGQRFEVAPPAGWPDVLSFRRDVEHAVDRVLVSFRKNNRVLTKGKVRYRDAEGRVRVNDLNAARGQLHKETVYGQRETASGRTGLHFRRSVEAITDAKQLNKVVDAGVRRRLEATLRSAGVDLSDTKAKFPKDVFVGVDEEKRKVYKVTMPNRRGEEVPVKQVRVRENLSKAVQLKPGLNQHVNPANNHHLVVYERPDGKLAEQVVSLWEAAARRDRGEPVVQLPPDGMHIVDTLARNDLFLLDLPPDIEFASADASVLSAHLYRVQNISDGDYTFRHHLASTIQHADQELRIRSFRKYEEVAPIKVRVSAAGRVTQLGRR